MIKEIHRPRTVDEAVRLKETLGDQAVFLAGGTEVNSSTFVFSGEHLINLAGLGLGGIRVTDDELVIGASCTIAELLDSTDIPNCLRTACLNIVNRNIRNVATLGGHLVCGKSCSDLVPVLVTLESVVEAASAGGTCDMPVLDYVELASKPLVTKIRIPKVGAGRLVAVDKYSRTSNDLSILAAAVALSRDGDCIRDPIIAVGGVARHVIRLGGVEGMLDGEALPTPDTIEGWVSDEVTPISDVRGSAEFKRYRAGVLVATSIQRAYHGKSEGTR